MISTSLVKALSILEATARHQGYRSLSDLATEARLSKPTAHRILKTLTSLGYVERTSAGQYRQSSQLRRLIGGTEDAELFNSANESLQRLHRLSGETVNLGVLRNGQISYLNVLESAKPLRRVVEVNSCDPIYCTALGRAILSRLPSVRRDFLLRSVQRNKRTPHTVIDLSELTHIIDRVTKVGYAIEKDETDIGVTCIAAAIVQYDAVVGAVSLSVPSARLDRSKESALINAIKNTTLTISKLLSKRGARA